MEEKERYELFGEHCIKDNSPDVPCQLLDAYKACVILNEQDKRIKRLQEEIKKANINNYLADYWLAEKEKQQLKQSQKQLAISELVKIKRYIDDNAYYIDEINFGEEINEYIDNQIKQLKELR